MNVMDLRENRLVLMLVNIISIGLLFIIFESILLFIVLIQIKNLKKMKTRQTPLPKSIIKNLKFK